MYLPPCPSTMETHFSFPLLASYYSQLSSFYLSLYVSSLLPKELSLFTISMIRSLVSCYTPLYCFPILLSWQSSYLTCVMLFGIIDSVATIGYAFTSEDLELGVYNEKEHVFVFLDLDYHVILFSVLSAYLQYSWFFFIASISVYVLNFHYQFIRWRSLRLFPFPSYCK